MHLIWLSSPNPNIRKMERKTWWKFSPTNNISNNKISLSICIYVCVYRSQSHFASSVCAYISARSRPMSAATRERTIKRKFSAVDAVIVRRLGVTRVERVRERQWQWTVNSIIKTIKLKSSEIGPEITLNECTISSVLTKMRDERKSERDQERYWNSESSNDIFVHFNFEIKQLLLWYLFSSHVHTPIGLHHCQ